MALEKIRPRVVDATGNYTFNDVTLTGNLSAPTSNIGNLTGVNNLVANSTTITVTGSLSTTANIIAGNLKTDHLLYANGVAWNISSGLTIAGTNTQVQFNDSSSLGASANFTFNKDTNTLTVSKISANGSALTSLTGANVTGTVANATYADTAGTATSATTAGTVTTALQPNITSVGTLSSLSITGNLASGNANLGNLAISNYFSGNGSLLSSITGGNVTGAVAYATTANAVAGSNVSGQVSYAATANAVAGSNVMGAVGLATYATTANAVAGANVSGAVAYATTANAVAGANVSGAVAYATTANAVAGANVSGQVSNALVAGTVYTAAQPNITSVGTLSSLAVTGNITSGNANLGNLTTSNYFTGNGSLLTGITAVSAGYIANGNSNVNIPSSNGNVTISAVGNANIVVVTGTGVNVTGYLNTTGNITGANANLGNLVTANYFNGSGQYLTSVTAVTAATVTTNAQPNITSVGTLTTLTVGNATANSVFGNGTITATGNISFTGANVSLGDISNLHILGGTSGYFVTTDGAGNLSWGATTGGGGTSVSGSNTQIQFNDGGSLGANANLTFNKTSKILSVDRTVQINGANLGSNVSNIYIGGGSANQILKTDGSGNLSWVAQPVATITVDNFTGDGSTVAFTLSTTPTSKNFTTVNYNGAFQLREAYSVSGTTITFTEAPATGSKVEVTTTSGATSGAGSFVTRTYTGDGTTTTYTVTSGVTVSSVLVTENGIVQTPTTDYTISGTILTFTSAPTNSMAIQIRELAIAIVTAPAATSLTAAVANVIITGGSSGQALVTDGAGNISFGTAGVPTGKVFAFNMFLGI